MIETKVSSLLEALFPSLNHSGGTVECSWKALCRRGNILLALPEDLQAARTALELYAPQKWHAKLLLKALKFSLIMRLLPRISHSFDPGSGFARFLFTLGVNWEQVSSLAIFFGNASSAGQRMLVLAFDADAMPVTLVKVGVTDLARQLIIQERDCLNMLKAKDLCFPVGLFRVPELRDTYSGVECEAFAMNFMPAGDAPGHDVGDQLSALFSCWLDKQHTSALYEFPQWQRLSQVLPAESPASKMLNHWKDIQVHPSLFHGDFTPWNIKVDRISGEWWILDWERGEATGIPGLDWLHYEIQVMLLVKGFDAVTIRQKIADFMDTVLFDGFCEQARLVEHRQKLFSFYLWYQIHVEVPSEGMETLKELSQLVDQE